MRLASCELQKETSSELWNKRLCTEYKDFVPIQSTVLMFSSGGYG